MKKCLFRFMLMFILAVSLMLPSVGRCEHGLPYSSYAPVLMYHDLKPVPLNGFDVTPEAFERQLDWLKSNGYRTLSIDEYIECINKGAFPEKSVLITFDDGYQGIYDYAVPALTKREMKAVFFIVTDAVDTALNGYPYITAKELKEISKNPYVSIGSHTVTHPSDLRLGTYRENLHEFMGSRGFLRRVTGQNCNALAYPCGNYDEAVIWAVSEAGYKAAFSVQRRGAMGQDTRWSIPRIYMGLSFCENDDYLFKKYVQEYAQMDEGMFKEQYYWINE